MKIFCRQSRKVKVDIFDGACPMRPNRKAAIFDTFFAEYFVVRDDLTSGERPFDANDDSYW